MKMETYTQWKFIHDQKWKWKSYTMEIIENGNINFKQKFFWVCGQNRWGNGKYKSNAVVPQFTTRFWTWFSYRRACYCPILHVRPKVPESPGGKRLNFLTLQQPTVPESPGNKRLNFNFMSIRIHPA